MLHGNRHDGFTIAVSESKRVAQIAKRTLLSDNSLPMLVPILEDIAEWWRPKIRQLFESYGFVVQGWQSVQTDWVRLLPGGVAERTATTEAVGPLHTCHPPEDYPIFEDPAIILNTPIRH